MSGKYGITPIRHVAPQRKRRACRTDFSHAFQLVGCVLIQSKICSQRKLGALCVSAVIGLGKNTPVIDTAETPSTLSLR